MTTQTSIAVVANGKEFTLSAGTRLPEFISKLGFEAGLVVVERNREALTPSEAGQTVLEHGDRLEIVQITAGG